MRNFNFFILITFLFCANVAQGQLTTPQASPKATTMQRIGITDITLVYHRPAVRNRKVWGTQAHYGFQNLGFGSSKAAPWRAGANENTTIEFSHDAKIEGKEIPAGKYGLLMGIEESGDITIIFSKNYSSWGSYFYDETEDALRVKVKWQDAPHTEFLKYEFTDMKQNSAILNLFWEKKKIPFKIEVDVHKTTIANFKDELRSDKGFNYRPWVSAANYCIRNNVALEQALEWSNTAISAPFVGEKNFTTLSTKASVLRAMGKTDDALKIMDEALPLATALEVHGYARQLLAMGQKEKALEIFQWNVKENKGVWPTNWGLARGYSANGDYKKAIKYAKIALTKAPDKLNKDNIENMMKKLEKGEDIN